MTHWIVPPLFAGRTVAVLASGPSMSADFAARVRHLPRIAVNSTYLRAPDADVIYAGDARWWANNPGALQCRGEKVSVEVRPGRADPLPEGVRVLRQTGAEGFDPTPGCVRTHGNSGAIALQIALHAGAARVLLLGFDMRGGHWHEPHPLINPSVDDFARWVFLMHRAARAMLRQAEIINCTPGSALKCFPMMSIDDALTCREAA